MTTSPLMRFWAAVTAGDDEAAEVLVVDLTAEDEPALLAHVTAPDADQRWWAIRALALHGTAAAPDAVAPAVADTDPSVRAVAALALAMLHGRQADAVAPYLPRLAPLLADPDGLVRQATADALAQCGDAAVDVLGTVLRGSVAAARTRAAYALRKIGTYRAAALLYPLLNDSNPLVRTYAYEGLDDMGLLENLLLMP